MTFSESQAMLANQASNFLSTGKLPERLGNQHPNIVPYQARTLNACAELCLTYEACCSRVLAAYWRSCRPRTDTSSWPSATTRPSSASFVWRTRPGGGRRKEI